MVRLSIASAFQVPRPDGRVDLVKFIRQAVNDPAIMEAIEVATPSLAVTLNRIDAGQPIAQKKIDSAAKALLRYLIRRGTRATPFGLFGAVGLARWMEEATTSGASDIAARFLAQTEDYRRWVRIDLGWLHALVDTLTSDVEVLRTCSVVLNNLVRVEDDRLYVDATQGDEGIARVSLRVTPALTHVLSHTREPTPFARLAAELSQLEPSRDCLAKAETYLRVLIEQRVLLTDQISFAGREPLLDLAARLRPCRPQLADDLIAAHDGARAYASSSSVDALEHLRSLRAHLKKLQDVEPSLHIDASLSETVLLPRIIADTARKAAEVLWKVAPDDHDRWPLREYQARFVERFGLQQAVPVTVLVEAARGIGLPKAYAETPERELRHLTSRDVVLAELAQTASAEGRPVELAGGVLEEVVGATAGGRGRPPDWLELIVSIFAQDWDGVGQGRFELLVHHTSAARAPGSMMARFAYTCPGAIEQLIDEVTIAAAPSDEQVQLLAHARKRRMDNIMRVGAVREEALAIGCAWSPEFPRLLQLEDIAVVADEHGLYLYSFTKRRRLRVFSYHMLSREAFQSPIGRLILDISAADERRWSAWLWDAHAISRMHLPEVRYENIILSTAKWRPPRALRKGSDTSHDWTEAFRSWARAFGVPEQLQVRNNDHTLDLDLSSPLHLRILRDELHKSPGSILSTSRAYDPNSVGWTGGRTTELIVPCYRAPTPRAQAEPVPRRWQRTAYLPGSEWIYAKLYVPVESQDSVLVHHLPRLLAALGPWTISWFFIRYQDPEPHLRLRFKLGVSGSMSDCIQAIQQWTADVIARGLAKTLQLDTYEPEVSRYGGSDLLPIAEEWFCLDSVATLSLLTLARRSKLRMGSVHFCVMNAEQILETFVDPQVAAESIWDVVHRDKNRQEWRAFKESYVAWRKAGELADVCTDTDAADRLQQAWIDRRDGGRNLLALAPGIAGWPILRSFLHMAHNRLVGPDIEHEQLCNRVLAEVCQHRARTRQ